MLGNILDSLKRSMWFVPMLMTLAGFFLSFGMYRLDEYFLQANAPLFASGADGMRYLFSSISGAIITALTTILSITLLIFTVLAGQFGSHILRAFKIRLFNKFVIGWFSGTYIYIIYYLYKVTTNSEFVPQLSIILGILLTLATIFLLLFYIHFLVKQIQAGTVISELANELGKTIQKMEPLEKKKEVKQIERKWHFKEDVSLYNPGYIQSIDHKELCQIAEKNSCFVHVLLRSGEFVATGARVFVVHSGVKIDEEIASKIGSCVITGDKRIPVEDLESNLILLLEMSLRALSPSVNDPNLANNCINYIGESIALLTTKQFPSPLYHDDVGNLLVQKKEFSFEGYVNAALNPLRQYAAPHCSVAIHLLDTLIMLIDLTTAEEYKAILVDHFNYIYQEASKKHPEEIDQKSFEKRRVSLGRSPHFKNVASPVDMS